jgi:hypothetical protein
MKKLIFLLAALLITYVLAIIIHSFPLALFCVLFSIILVFCELET